MHRIVEIDEIISRFNIIVARNEKGNILYHKKDTINMNTLNSFHFYLHLDICIWLFISVSIILVPDYNKLIITNIFEV